DHGLSPSEPGLDYIGAFLGRLPIEARVAGTLEACRRRRRRLRCEAGSQIIAPVHRLSSRRLASSVRGISFNLESPFRLRLIPCEGSPDALAVSEYPMRIHIVILSYGGKIGIGPGREPGQDSRQADTSRGGRNACRRTLKRAVTAGTSRTRRIAGGTPWHACSGRGRSRSPALRLIQRRWEA